MNHYKEIIAVVGFLAVIAVAVFVLSGSSRVTGGQTATLLDAVTADDHVRGATTSAVTLVEYSDFQCPACGAYYPLVHQLADEFGDRLTIAYRHFPLSQIHDNAEEAAYAAEAAGKQGKFWEMHDLLFEYQKDWAGSKAVDGLFASYATALGLDLAQFNADRASEAVREKVRADYGSGIRSKVEGTPTFFLNGERIANPTSYDDFRTLVTAALE